MELACSLSFTEPGVPFCPSTAHGESDHVILLIISEYVVNCTGKFCQQRNTGGGNVLIFLFSYPSLPGYVPVPKTFFFVKIAINRSCVTTCPSSLFQMKLKGEFGGTLAAGHLSV